MLIKIRDTYLAKYGIRSVPCLVLVNENGEEIKRSVGVQSREVIF